MVAGPSPHAQPCAAAPRLNLAGWASIRRAGGRPTCRLMCRLNQAGGAAICRLWQPTCCVSGATPSEDKVGPPAAQAQPHALVHICRLEHHRGRRADADVHATRQRQHGGLKEHLQD